MSAPTLGCQISPDFNGLLGTPGSPLFLSLQLLIMGEQLSSQQEALWWPGKDPLSLTLLALES